MTSLLPRLLIAVMLVSLTGCSGSTGTQPDSSTPYRTLKSAKPQTRAVAFSGDGKLLATGTADTVEVWDIAGEKIIATFTVQDGPVRYGETSMAFSPDGKTVATGA